MVPCFKGPLWGGRGQIEGGGKHDSMWWRSLCRVRGGVGEGVGSWFDNNVCQMVGNGKTTLFWFDHWVGETPLRFKFPRLFDLVINKDCTVEEMKRLGWEVGGWKGVDVETAFVSLGGGKCEGVFRSVT